MKGVSVHYITEIVATYETAPGKVHEASRTTRHPYFDVATTIGGYVHPGSIKTCLTRDEAIAEVQRRAVQDHANRVIEEKSS